MSGSPNIVLFLVDQLRQDALGCYGNTLCKTPHLDRLSSEGVTFDHAYTTSPVCSPARATILSGLYPHNHGVMINTHIGPAWCRGLSPDTPTFSRALSQEGYVLDYVGKWHVHADLGPEEFGFYRYEQPKVRYESVPGTEIYIDYPRGRQLACSVLDAPREEHHTWKCATRGIEFLKERASGKQPFFLRMDIQAPHFANIVPEPYASMYDPSSIPPWPNFDESFGDKPASHLRKHVEWNLQEKDWAWWQPVVAKYYGDISLIDTCVGRVLDAIDEAGIADETLFIFSTDHGDSMGSHKHFEKAGTMYDEVYRIPLIIRMPGATGRRSEFVRSMDLMPTIMEAAGCKPPDTIDALSLLPVLDGSTPDDWPESVYCEHHGEVWGYHSQRSVRTHDWKYVYNPTDLDELYDLAADPYEMQNRINDLALATTLNDLKAKLLGWNDATGDMFRWNWVRWNFPEPILPKPYAAGRLPVKFQGK